MSRRKLEDLIEKVVTEHSKDLSRSVSVLVTGMKELAVYSYEFEAGAIMSATSAVGIKEEVGRTAIWNRALERPLSVDGGLLDDWLDNLSTSQITATENMLRRAHAEGWSNQTMLRAFRGTRANRFKDGIVEKIGRGNEIVIRTAIQHVNSVARLQVWSDNSEVVKKYRWVSTLDSRTSDECRGLDGQEFDLDKGPIPPIHRGCRSTTVAVVDSKFDFLDRGATRASERGPVPQNQTYYDWLSQQSAAYQDSVIGPTRGRLLRNGGLTSEQFARLQLSRTFEPLTLDEMRKLKPLAFERAGI